MFLVIIIMIIISGDLYSALFILGYAKALYTENKCNYIQHANPVKILLK